MIKDTIDIIFLGQHVDKTVSVDCWMYNKRDSGKLKFLQLRDGTGFIQGVLSQGDVSPEIWEIGTGLTTESSLKLTGKVVQSPKGILEIQISGISPYQIIPVEDEYPIGKKDHGPEFLFDERHLYVRSMTPWAVLRIRDRVFTSIQTYLHEEGFIRTDSPVLQPTSCEDTSQLFEVDYYGDPMYLSQSGQLYSEATVFGFKKVYDFGPTFRAEKSKTRYHLSEFWMMDAEMAFCDQDTNEDIQEGLVKRILKDVCEHCTKELEILGQTDLIPKFKKIVESPFVRMKHRDVKALLEKEGLKVDYKDDMTTEEELKLGEIFDVPVFVEDFPYETKSFYMKKYFDGDMDRARCADLIAPFGGREIIGGSQREEDLDVLIKEMKRRKYDLAPYEWYLDLRRYGSVPHAGFGIGPERTLRWITGVDHIRETIPFPRTLVRRFP